MEICVADSARLTLPTLAAFQAEMSALAPAAKLRWRDQRCEVRIHLELSATEESPDVLGRVRKSDGRILPELQVFVPAVLHLLGESRSATLAGRALARVAAHELGHYLNQSADHQESGIMREYLTAAELAAPDRSRFVQISGFRRPAR
jgi:hypothetical protein